MVGTVKILDGSGHTPVAYDTEGGIVTEAENVLASTRYNRSAVFDGKTKERVSDPASDPSKVLSEHEELIVLPPMAGG